MTLGWLSLWGVTLRGLNPPLRWSLRGLPRCGMSFLRSGCAGGLLGRFLQPSPGAGVRILRVPVRRGRR
ncbi:hypothetical protein DFQ14_101410 [Halopolyspora algeriensis]|uniref:Uncharacterized protein n=1 Tax=Halopolyspora algeriensis TaxID=1500506 RepID=A0A368VXY7_9ACTN|nr:hypothetical protein DFQ14_101410 [Halopolyspora algeriensis]TQM48153.1 hypothetical protein FHU43_3115 [Halopolyspora algeriensis]